jgi:hypothetical protein
MVSARVMAPRAPARNILNWDISGGKVALAGWRSRSTPAEYQRLCTLLRELRHAAGLTQVLVAGRLDMPQSFVNKYESGERRLDVIELHHVAEALGTTVGAVVH